jgi:crotonobetainyl-CoA:carnitine CoA-transferase CaiB-like acyl-CoA transferase
MTDRPPLEGIRVVDVSQGIAGPHCGMLLALYGAEVIKIEPPAGDWMRQIGPRYGKQTSHSANYNRGKKSIVLDLKNPDALAVARKLVDRADVFIENFRPGAVGRLGLGYDVVRRTNPRLVYLSISGYGQTGPYRDRPCTDTVAQAFSGMMTMNRAVDGTPVKAQVFMIDAVTGLYGFQAVSMALLARQASGVGRYLDVSLMQSIAAILSPHLLDQYIQDGPPRLPNVPGGVYQSKDGWVLVTLLHERQYQAICRVLGLPELAEDPRFNDFEKRAHNKDILLPMLQQAFLTETSAVWAERMREADVLTSPVQTPLEWLSEPHVQAVNAAPMVTQPDLGAVPVPNVPGAAPSRDGDPRHRLPDVGEHTQEVLSGLGLSASQIAALSGGKAA